MVIVLAVLVVGGCALSTSPPVSSDTGPRPPGDQTPSNFASPTDLFQRYPSMRHQDL